MAAYSSYKETGETVVLLSILLGPLLGTLYGFGFPFGGHWQKGGVPDFVE